MRELLICSLEGGGGCSVMSYTHPPTLSITRPLHYPGVFDRNSISTNLAHPHRPLSQALLLSFSIPLSFFLSLSLLLLTYLFTFILSLTLSFSSLRRSWKASLCIPRDKLRGSIIHGNLLRRLNVVCSSHPSLHKHQHKLIKNKRKKLTLFLSIWVIL